MEIVNFLKNLLLGEKMMGINRQQFGNPKNYPDYILQDKLNFYRTITYTTRLSQSDQRTKKNCRRTNL